MGDRFSLIFSIPLSILVYVIYCFILFSVCIILSITILLSILGRLYVIVFFSFLVGMVCLVYFSSYRFRSGLNVSIMVLISLRCLTFLISVWPSFP